MAAPVAEPSLYKDLTNSDKPGGVKVGDTLWRGWAVNVCRELAEELRKLGSSEHQARAAVFAFQDEVQQELSRLHQAGNG